MGCGQSSNRIEAPMSKKPEEPRLPAPEEIKNPEDLNYKELYQL